MMRRKNNGKVSAGSTSSNSEVESRKEYLVEDMNIVKEMERSGEEVVGDRAESSNMDVSVDAIVGSEKTSADYYFDSYSHFGEKDGSFFLLPFFPSPPLRL